MYIRVYVRQYGEKISIIRFLRRPTGSRFTFVLRFKSPPLGRNLFPWVSHFLVSFELGTSMKCDYWNNATEILQVDTKT